MRMRPVVALLAAALSGCMGMGRISSYPTRLADAKVSVDGRGFSIWVHEREDTLLVQRAAGAAIGQGILEGRVLDTVNLMEPRAYWLAAARQITDPLGCQVTEVYTLDNRTSWEAPYRCPPGVDLRATVKAERSSLRDGIPIHPLPATP